MSLSAFQDALARRVLAADPPPDPGSDRLTAAERSCLDRLSAGAGLRVTAKVQRSWCLERAFDCARTTLSALPPAARERLVTQWVEAGGGTASFAASEAADFLAFIARALPDPSPELTLCRIEQAVVRAADAALTFVPPDLAAMKGGDLVLRTHSAASLVRYAAQPARSADDEVEALFAPGIADLCRPAEAAEVRLWRGLETPTRLEALRRRGHADQTVRQMLLCGAIEPEPER